MRAEYYADEYRRFARANKELNQDRGRMEEGNAAMQRHLLSALTHFGRCLAGMAGPPRDAAETRVLYRLVSLWFDHVKDEKVGRQCRCQVASESRAWGEVVD